METKICKCCGKELPITEFGTGKGHGVVFTRNVCTSCMKGKQREGHAARKAKKEITHAEELEQARCMRIKDFTPRELMEELARRGYTGKLQFTEVHEIDIENF